MDMYVQDIFVFCLFWIDTFISEEIDLDTFSTLNESDLRSLGVTAYPSRKRMLVLITQLATPRPGQDWTSQNSSSTNEEKNNGSGTAN